MSLSPPWLTDHGTAPIYTSETVPARVNPRWADLNPHAAVLTHAQRTSQRVRLVVSAVQRLPALCPALGRPHPAWLLAGAEPASPTLQPVLQLDIDLSQLLHMGGSPFLSLSPNSSHTSHAAAFAKYCALSVDGEQLRAAKAVVGGAGDGHGQGSLFPCLECLPRNTLFVQLEDGFYAQHATARHMFDRQRMPWQVLGRPGRPPPPLPATESLTAQAGDGTSTPMPSALRPAPVSGQLQAQQSADGQGEERVSQPTPRPDSAPPSRGAGASRPASTSRRQRGGGTPGAGQQNVDLAVFVQQVGQLLRASAALHAQQERRRQLLARAAACMAEVSTHPPPMSARAAPVPPDTRCPAPPQRSSSGGGTQFSSAGSKAPASAEAQAQLALVHSQSYVRLSAAMLGTVRQRLFDDLRALYPIDTVQAGALYKIKGVQLPGSQLNKAPPNQVGTALGHVCHVVQLASRFLGTPLRYVPLPAGSFSGMQDAVEGHGVMPLYPKGVDAATFAKALAMLQVCVVQLAQAVGIQTPFSRSGHVLGNLLAVYEAVLGAPQPMQALANQLEEEVAGGGVPP